jgi:peptidoglycan biosynthesis protein MviN/MurJ (putative lipid II flippase)
MSGQMLLSAGHARDTVVLSALSVVVFLLAVSLAAPHGITKAACAAGVANMLVLPVYLKRLKYRFGLDLWQFLKGQGPVWSATLAMVVAVLCCQQVLGSTLAAWSMLAVSATVGAGVFFSVMVIFALAEVREICLVFPGIGQREREPRPSITADRHGCPR